METIDQIELHDSVAYVTRNVGEVILELRPAYVHHWRQVGGQWQGIGRTQTARIRLTAGRVVPDLHLTAAEIADGWIRVGDDLYDNLLPVPFTRVGAVTGRIELVNAEPIELWGTAIGVELIGPSKDIEELPAEWAPVRRAV
jgi:hypothetical protein